LTHFFQTVCGGKTKPKVDDKVLKTRIIARYSYIDQAESSREHRPVAPKQVSCVIQFLLYFNANLFEHLCSNSVFVSHQEPKKMIRYRDNKIVSLKGERFSEVKKDDEEVSSKKTLVNLKPAKQYKLN